ncbi:unnamed protein product [Nippostrongylus brasiliensis]|uniref:TNFAIP3-interacting protein 1-like n=1 Tax=Nippostrongylus brasiliensis TaxID=27835 RepID=A0A0N4YNY7_NIPBR|nr:unnamed protein product [Nippostrongylus brasiliensis]
MDKTANATREKAAKKLATTPASSQNARSAAPKQSRPAPSSEAHSVPTAPPKRQSESSSSSSTSSKEDLLRKKDRASGTILKELLQQGSRILQHAASKIDQLAPAVTVSSSPEIKECIKELEHIVKAHHKMNTKLLKANEAKLEKLELKMELLTARFSDMEKTFKQLKPQRNEQCQPEQWQDFYNEFKRLQEQMSQVNTSKLTDDIRSVSNRLDELLARKETGPAEASSELDRIRRQRDRAERELSAVRRETLDVSHSLERKWQKDCSPGGVEDLREKRRRLQDKEARLEMEIRELNRRLEREKYRETGSNEDPARKRRREYSRGRRVEGDGSQERRSNQLRDERRDNRHQSPAASYDRVQYHDEH